MCVCVCVCVCVFVCVCVCVCVCVFACASEMSEKCELSEYVKQQGYIYIYIYIYIYTICAILNPQGKIWFKNQIIQLSLNLFIYELQILYNFMKS